MEGGGGMWERQIPENCTLSTFSHFNGIAPCRITTYGVYMGECLCFIWGRGGGGGGGAGGLCKLCYTTYM